MVEGVDRPVEQGGKGLGPLLQKKVGRIQFVGKREDAQVDLFRNEQAEDFVGPFATGFVAVA